jgi:indolepyruvate ferredoxin oxidoreductase
MPPRPPIALDDRYALESGRVFLTGVQALVRLPMEQARRDRAAGLRTGTFVTGYPGSPLGGYDLALAQVRRLCEPLGIVHRPAQNEEMAATALMGTQMLERYEHARCDGVVGFWYGKGPGLDRAGDAIRHGNYAGTTRHGAVVVLSGEDHEAKSSTMPFGQENYFVHAGMPVLHPASVAEFLELGLHAVALSRYSGLWVAMKLVGQLCDGGETVDVDPGRPSPALPDFQIDGRPFAKRQYHRFFPGETVETERILYAERLPAAVAYARANRLDRVEAGTPRDRLAIVGAGKSWADTLQALSDLGLDAPALAAGGIRLVKLGLIHPLDRSFLAEALGGVEQVIVVEEKRGFLEQGIRDALYHLPERPRVLGKLDERGAPLFPDYGGMDADLVARLLGPRLLALPTGRAAQVERRLEEIRSARERPGPPALLRRTPSYCSGCPHNVSTAVLPGQVAWSAPGCHVFATLIDQPRRHADATFQLGGEGLAWIGLAPFTDRRHVVQNQGDGALFHSSYANIRFAVASGVHITFRILYNGAVANTGAQAPVGQRDVPTLARLLALEGVSRIAIVARDPRDYRGKALPANATVHHREEVDEVLRELEAAPGVTVFLYDGECANERRRKQKRALRPGSSHFVLVNEAVCENCGDCGTAANCMSLQKVETELGEKTQIHQSTCNQDQLCLQGDCPSFVSVEVSGGGPRRPAPAPVDPAELPEPERAHPGGPWRIVIPGVGGTGVLTVNSVLSWAALLDGKEVISYDQTGAAQKWGAVLSSLALADPGQRPPASRVGLGRADLYLACDAMAGADRDNLARCDPERTAAVVNTTLFPSGEMIRDVHLDPGLGRMVAAISRVCRPDRTVKVEARRVAEALFGDHLATNVFALGVAYQSGFLPLSSGSIEAAMALNGTAVEQNLQAFRQGRRWRLAPEAVEASLRRPEPSCAQLVEREAADLGAGAARYRELLGRCGDMGEGERRLVALRLAELFRYQGPAWAERYLETVLRVLRREREALGPGADLAVTRGVARGLHRLMAYKDEYEVARLHLRAAMQRRAEADFEGRVRIHYLLHPPLLRALGLGGKLRLGRWIEPGLWLLARMRGLRGTPLDPFGRARVRRLERSLIAWYQGAVEVALERLGPGSQARVAELARLPDEIRGYEQVKMDGAARAMARAEALLRQLRDEPAARAAAN